MGVRGTTYQQLKRFCDIIATILIAPVALAFWGASLVAGAGHVFPGFAQAFSLLPGLGGQFARRAFYKLILPRCGLASCISFGTVFSHPTVCLGRKVYIGIGCMIGDVTLEDDVLVGSHVSIINGNRQHGIDRLDSPVRDQPGQYPRITIGEDTWIGDRAIVMANVGKHCVVGAGSVVTKSVPDYAIVVGNPARIQGFRNQLDGDTANCLTGRAQSSPPLASTSSLPTT